MTVQADLVPVTIRILDKEYQIACSEEERHSLLDSARYLDERMKEIRNTGKVIGSERVAVMAALNIANEYLQSENIKVNSKIKGMAEKLESAINKLK